MYSEAKNVIVRREKDDSVVKIDDQVKNRAVVFMAFDVRETGMTH